MKPKQWTVPRTDAVGREKNHHIIPCYFHLCTNPNTQMTNLLTYRFTKQKPSTYDINNQAAVYQITLEISHGGEY